jgi:hypothetical protein
MPVPVGTGWTIDADSSERSEVRVGGVLCDEVRTNQARSPVHTRRFGKSCLVTLLGENFDQVSKFEDAGAKRQRFCARKR